MQFGVSLRAPELELMTAMHARTTPRFVLVAGDEPDIQRSGSQTAYVNAMTIKVKLHGRARVAAGLDEIEVAEKARTVGELLDALTARIGTEFRRTMLDSRTNELSANLILLVNGHSVRMLNGLKTPLLETDVVTIDTVELLEIVGGG